MKKILQKRNILLLILIVSLLVFLIQIERIEKEQRVEERESEAMLEQKSPSAKESEKKEGSFLILKEKKGDSFIPLIHLEGWQVSGPFLNPEICGQKSLFINQRPVYCRLADLKDSYSVFWQKNAQTEQALMPEVIIASVFEFSDKFSLLLKDVINAHPLFLNFLEDFNLDDNVIKRYTYNPGLDPENRTSHKGRVSANRTEEIFYFDIFSLENIVFVFYYNGDYKDEAEIIEKSTINNTDNNIEESIINN